MSYIEPLRQYLMIKITEFSITDLTIV